MQSPPPPPVSSTKKTRLLANSRSLLQHFHRTMAKFLLLPPLLLGLLLPLTFQFSVADFASDRAECTNQLVGLATCLPYVQGNAKAPTPDCCTGLKEVLSKSPKCLCVLVKDRDDPQLGIKINVSLALALPDACSTPAKISECPRLLKLPPNSSEARIFTQPQGPVKGSSSSANSTAEGSPTTSAHESNGGMTHHLVIRKEWLRVERVGVLLLMLVLPLLFSA